MEEEYHSPLVTEDLRNQVAEAEHATDNGTLAQLLSEIAELIELQGGAAVYRARAYRKAADTINTLAVGLVDLYHQGGIGALQDLPNIGKSIAERLAEFIVEGRSSLHEELRAKYPRGMVELMSVPGIGPKTAYKLSADYNITSLAQLEEAARGGRLQELFKGRGVRLEEDILAWLSRARLDQKRLPRYLAEPLEASLLNGLRACPAVVNAGVAGSFRRLEDTIGNLDYVAATTDPVATTTAFGKLPQVRTILSRTAARITIVSHTGTNVDLHLVSAEMFEAALLYFTGPSTHLALLRERAVELGITLPQLGTVEDPPQAGSASEETLYHNLQLPYLPPELRQGSDELNLVFERTPESLITQAQIQGDLHTHTDWSDGAHSLDRMVQAAIELGYRYYAICDHSGGLGVARGLTNDRRAEQIALIHEMRDSLPDGFTLLAGIEVDIRADGTLDCPDYLLEQLDWVVASIHSHMRQDRATMTRRFLAAIEHPLVNAIGHLTTRLLTGRPPVDVDIEELFEAAQRTGTAIEINGGPDRLDINEHYARRAREMGIKLIVSSDAHKIDHLPNFMNYAVTVARRAWCQPSNILNAATLQEVQAFVATKRARYHK